ncbi:MAG: PAC2 family protein [Candidatus Micrarchaeota archaeon]|nr:PAC2 family protein [Candidatus Micrarchaeota archaeon]MCX8154295.1 PAC2 family protein [Candidatus Micrarchaeota archaeon]
MEIYIQHSKIRGKVKRVIMGFPGVGLIGLITTDYIARNSNFRLIGEILSSTFTPARALIVGEGLVSTYSTKIYYSKDTSTMILVGENQPNNPYRYLKHVLEMLKKKYNPEYVIGIGGYANHGETSDEIFMFSHKKEILDKFRDMFKPGAAVVGNVVGVLALLPIMAEHAGMDGIIVLKTVTKPDSSDVHAARTMIRKLDELFKFRVNFQEIDKIITDIDQRQNELIKEYERLDREATKQYIR